MAIKVVTDSTSDLDSAIAEDLGITIVPLNVHFGETVFKDGIDLNTDQFFDKLINGNVFPSTSQPSLGEFVDVYKEISQPGDVIISVHVSSKLSGTINSAQQAANTLSGTVDVRIVDTQQVSMTVGLSAVGAAQAAQEGKSAEECIAIAESVAKRSNFFALFDTLEYLEKGGRIGKARSLIGGLLKIRPILRVEDGEIGQFSKARSRNMGMLKLEQAVRELGKLDDIAIVYSTDGSDAEKLAATVKELLPDGKSPFLTRVGPVIGTHAGPNLVAIAAITSDS
ncbi:MAG: DegV family protein [Dehalococcoidia bacterium]|jgi:DegV family protein with EDD domain|nr:MAG: DegV family protein [SAR202 cluster bacterium]MAR86339.1 fatty acid-binding protein DegV [Chloroflexota bacterium]|tara:strand:+ start:480 stop:1325 length:846 start_codon:yes stop_codon:yes gene_type:complete